MAKNRQRLIQLERFPDGADPGREFVRYVPLTHFDGEVDHKGEPMLSGELGYQYPPWMNWRGFWASGGTYYPNEVVRDGCWVMIANKETTDRPAPQPDGAGEYGMPTLPAFNTETNTSSVYSGHLYEFTEYGWVQQIRVWVPSISGTTNYRFIILNVTDPDNPIFNDYTTPIAIEGSWVIIAVDNRPVVPGTKWLVYIDALNTGGSTIVTGGWTGGTIDNNNNPATQSWNRNNQQTIVRIDKTDLDSTNRATELLGVIPGSTIQIADTATPTNNYLYQVTGNAVDAGSAVTYEVNLVSTNGGGATIGVPNTITIDIPVPQPTEYVELPSWYPTNSPTWATVTGFLELNGIQPPGSDLNAYGVDIYFQPATVSEDWNLIANICSGSGGGGGGGITHAPNDGLMYGSRNGAWQNTISGDPDNTLIQGSDGGLFVPVSGGSSGGGLWDATNNDTEIAVNSYRILGTGHEISSYDGANVAFRAYNNNSMFLQVESGNEPGFELIRNGLTRWRLFANVANPSSLIFKTFETGTISVRFTNISDDVVAKLDVDGTNRGRLELNGTTTGNDFMVLNSALGRMDINREGTPNLYLTNTLSGATLRHFVSGNIAYYQVSGAGNQYLWRDNANAELMTLVATTKRLRLYDYGVGNQLDNSAPYLAGFDANGNFREVEPSTLGGGTISIQYLLNNTVPNANTIRFSNGFTVLSQDGGDTGLIAYNFGEFPTVPYNASDTAVLWTATNEVRRIPLSDLGGGNTIYSGDDLLAGNRVVSLNAFNLTFKDGSVNTYVGVEADQGFWMGMRFHDALGDLQIGSIQVQRPFPQQPNAVMQFNVHDGVSEQLMLSLDGGSGITATKHLNQTLDDATGSLNMGFDVSDAPNIVARTPGTGVNETVTLLGLNSNPTGVIYVVNKSIGSTGTVTIAVQSGDDLNGVPSGTLVLNNGERAVCIPSSDGWWTISQ